MSFKLHEIALEQDMAERLRSRRIKLGLRQNVLAARLGVSRQTMFVWEIGAVVPRSIARWDAWARALGMKIRIELSER